MVTDKIGGVADKIANVLADTYTLMLKTQNYHWNVTGYRFRSLHSMFEEQYKELFDAVDLLAERIRALGFLAPASYEAFADLSTIKGETDSPDADTMLRNLESDHQIIRKVLYELVDIAETVGDEVSIDMAVERLRAHEKYIWMLGSMLENEIG